MDGPALLRSWRLGRGLSLKQAGRLLRVSAPTVLAWEAREKHPRADHQFRVDRESGGEVPVASWAANDDARADVLAVLARGGSAPAGPAAA